MKQKVKYKGILFIVLSALCFAFMNMFVRMAGDLPAVQKSFFRNLVAFIIALATMVRHKEVFQVEKGNWKYMILRAGFGTLGILCNFYAVDHLVLSDASMLNKMSPFFVILFSFLILKEKLTPIQVTAVCGAFIGSLFIIKPTFLNMNIVPSLIGLCGGLCAGIAYTMVRVLGQRGQKGVSVVLFFSRIFLSGDAAVSAAKLSYHEHVAGHRSAGSRSVQPQADSLPSQRHITMHRPERFRSMTILRLFFRRSSVLHCFIRFRTVTVCWGMSSSSAWQYGCSSITSVGMHRT